jgi:hypothetical protein
MIVVSSHFRQPLDHRIFGTWISACRFGKYTLSSWRGEVHTDVIGPNGSHDHINRNTFHDVADATELAISFGDL